MHYRPYDLLEKKIFGSDEGGFRYRWEYGRHLATDDEAIFPSGRLRKGVTAELVAKATDRGYKLSEREVQYRLQFALAYPTEAEFRTAVRNFDSWDALRRSGFLPVEVSDPGEPYDPRAPHKKRDDAGRQLDRILNNPEAHGQLVLPGLRMYMPGFTPDTVGRETLFREAFKIHRYIRDEVTPQLGKAFYQAGRDDREREAKLNRLFDAVNRNPEATLGEGDDAFWAARDASAPDE